MSGKDEDSVRIITMEGDSLKCQRARYCLVCLLQATKYNYLYISPSANVSQLQPLWWINYSENGGTSTSTQPAITTTPAFLGENPTQGK